MTVTYLLFAGLCLGVAREIYAVDLTLKPGETSDAVIDATIRKIRTKCILAQDYYFLRRLAEAQMESIAATTGGIWRVNDTQLTTVQKACYRTLYWNCSKVQTEFNINVWNLNISDLQKPLHSGLVMSLFILTLDKLIPLSKKEQAAYWVQYINANGSENSFIDSADKLENKTDCASAQIDLVFVIDASGSVGSDNFKKTKTFLNNVVSNLDISNYETRVAVIRYSSSPLLIFGLDTHSTKTAVTNAISAILYTAGGTATDLALDEVRTMVFTNTTRKSAAAKVLVLVTDGHSNNENKTVAAAQRLKDAGVTIFTIGVVNPRVSELTAAASEPSCTHYIDLKDYNEIDFIVKEIESGSCKAPTEVPEDILLVNNTIPKTNETKQQVLQVTNTTKSTLGTTVLVSVRCGRVIVYASFNNSYPNEADYDYKTSATDDEPGKLFLLPKTELTKLALNVLSKRRFDLNSSACNNPSYDINIKPTAPRIKAACIVKKINSSCTAKQLDSACYNGTSVVGEVSRLFNNSILQNGQVQEQVLEIGNSTHSSGNIIWVSAQCAEVTVYGAFNNSYPIEADHHYKTSARDGYLGKIFAMRKSKYQNFTLTIFSKSDPNLNLSSCHHPSYTISIMPKDPEHEVVCHRRTDERHCTPAETKAKCPKTPKTEMACIVKHVRSKCSAKRLDPACYDSKPVISDINKLFDNCVEKYGEIQERVLVINNSTDSSGSSIMVKAECAEVSVYVAFNKRHPTENDCDDKTFATDGSPGKLDVVKNTKRDQLSVTIRSRRRYGLKSISCHHPSYTVSIKPKDHMFEVACHLKRDERPCSDEEKRDKCKDDPRNPPSAGYRQLSINAWISTGLLVAWRLA